MTNLKRGLIVSCQAEDGSPFNSQQFISAFAKAAELGGAVGVRVRDYENVRAVKNATTLPVIGLTKGFYKSGKVLITPVIEDVSKLADSGADIVAVDATGRTRPNGMSGLEFLGLAKSRLNIPVMADISRLDEALAAAEAGADFVGTTLSGYTEDSGPTDGLPDLELIKAISSRTRTPLIAEGRIWTPEQAKSAIEFGAYAVCVGTAITRPVDIVQRFALPVMASIFSAKQP